MSSNNRHLFRIAFCLPKLTGGADFLLQTQIAKGLQSRGHSLTFVAPRDLSDTVCTGDLQTLTLASRTWSKSSWFNVARKITWHIQQRVGVPYLNVFSNYSLYDACLQCLPGHDIVQERNGLYKAGVAMACKRLKLPYVLFFDGDDLYEHEFAGQPITGLLRWRAQNMVRYNLSTADRILCVSNSAKKRLVTVWGVPEEKIDVFPNAVDVNLYHPHYEERGDIRRSLGIGENPLIVFVGGFYHWHDVSGLLDAFVIVLRHCPEARLVLIGDGVKRDAMIQKTSELQINPYVNFLGSVPHVDIPPIVNAADVAVAPYVENPQLGLWGSPMKLFEYMACGTAVVASSLGQITEVIQDGYNGLLSPKNDVDALASAILKLIEDPALRTRLGQQARQDVVMEYSLDRYLSRLERVYHAVISQQSINVNNTKE